MAEIYELLDSMSSAANVFSPRFLSELHSVPSFCVRVWLAGRAKSRYRNRDRTTKEETLLSVQADNTSELMLCKPLGIGVVFLVNQVEILSIQLSVQQSTV